jgi:uncharacterized membrane protein
MQKVRVWLVVLPLVSILSVVLIAILTPAIAAGKMANDWVGAFGLLMAGSVIANVVLSFRYAWKTGRRAGLWAIGAILFPYIVPIILAILPGVTAGIEIQSTAQSEHGSKPASITQNDSDVSNFEKEKLFASIPVPNPVFKLKKGVFGSSEWALDQLRLFCVIVPGSFKWRVITSSKELSFIFLDILPSEQEYGFYGVLEEICSTGNPNDVSGLKICLADYNDKGVVFDLSKLRNNSKAFIASLYHLRDERKKRLEQWIRGNPQVTLRGGLGSRAILNRDGFHLKKRSISWKDVDKINTETSIGASHMFVLPTERSGGFFDIKKAKYALARIPSKKTELYAAEAFFWKNYCGV